MVEKQKNGQRDVEMKKEGEKRRGERGKY
jgi:hypothetical protein